MDILKRAAAILRPLVKEAEPQKSKPGETRKSKTSSTRGVTNAFSKLEVEEPDVLDETQEDDTNATSTFGKRRRLFLRHSVLRHQCA